MGYYADYSAVFDRVKDDIDAISGLTVILGGPFRLGVNMPCAVINPMPSRMGNAYTQTGIETRIGIEVILIIRETAPEDWFADIIKTMGDVVDAILADRTLNGLVLDTIPTLFAPAEVKFESKLYYGGVVRLEATHLHEP